LATQSRRTGLTFQTIASAVFCREPGRIEIFGNLIHQTTSCFNPTEQANIASQLGTPLSSATLF